MEVSKKQLLRHAFSKIVLATIALFVSVIAFAQDKKIEVDIDTDKGGGIMGSPWVWVVGAAVFILLLVALLRGNNRRGA